MTARNPLVAFWHPWPTEAAWLADHAADADTPDEAAARLLLAAACRRLNLMMIEQASVAMTPEQCRFLILGARAVSSLASLPVPSMLMLAQTLELTDVE